jgi:hypothetical protein
MQIKNYAKFMQSNYAKFWQTVVLRPSPAARPGPSEGRRRLRRLHRSGAILSQQSNIICHVEQAVVHNLKMNAVLLLPPLNYFLLAVEHLSFVVQTLVCCARQLPLALTPVKTLKK